MGFVCAGLVAIVAALIVVIARPAPYLTDIPPALDQAVAESLFTRENVSLSDLDLDGQTVTYAPLPVSRDGYECLGEGHEILGYKEKDGKAEVYALCSVTGYGFRNGMLVDNYGYSCVPIMFTFEGTAEDGYRFKAAREAMDGADFVPSIKKMFPAALAKAAINAQGGSETTDSLRKQCDAYAETYLKAIGREAKVTSYFEEELETLATFGVSADVSNELLALRPEFGIYLGNFEELEESGRVLYSVKWDGDENGTGTVTYVKTRLDTGKVLNKYIYSIEGDTFRKVKPKNK